MNHLAFLYPILRRVLVICVSVFLGHTLPAATFTIDSTTPAVDSKTIGQNATIAITFEKALAANWAGSIAIHRNGAPGLYAGVNPLSVPGFWTLSDPKTATFTPSAPYPTGSLLMVKIASSLTATDGSTYASPRGTWSFMVTPGPGVNYPTTEHRLVVRTVIQNGVSHELPIRIINPATSGPHPVMLWVHGGSWKGGTAASSGVGHPFQADYLAARLGVACVSVSYRCLGSDGTFAQGLSDINFTVNYIRNNAAAYNIDPTRIGLYGASAGTPLSSLVAQQQGLSCYVGFNGLYDFTSNPGSNFPTDNQYQWQSPTPRANSAFYHLATPPPNTLLQHGSVDTIINPQQSVLFGNQITGSGGQARVLIYNGAKHGFFNTGNEMELPTLYQMKEHLKTVFGL